MVLDIKLKIVKLLLEIKMVGMGIQVYKFINVGASTDKIPALLYHQLDINGVMLIRINVEYTLI